jgi:hypothetical protein
MKEENYEEMIGNLLSSATVLNHTRSPCETNFIPDSDVSHSLISVTKYKNYLAMSLLLHLPYACNAPYITSCTQYDENRHNISIEFISGKAPKSYFWFTQKKPKNSIISLHCAFHFHGR